MSCPQTDSSESSPSSPQLRTPSPRFSYPIPTGTQIQYTRFLRHLQTESLEGISPTGSELGGHRGIPVQDPVIPDPLSPSPRYRLLRRPEVTTGQQDDLTVEDVEGSCLNDILEDPERVGDLADECLAACSCGGAGHVVRRLLAYLRFLVRLSRPERGVWRE